MSAEDNPLDYLHVPLTPVDRAITKLEDSMKTGNDLAVVMKLVVAALRELDRCKRERW